jgi:hypothetical protein
VWNSYLRLEWKAEMQNRAVNGVLDALGTYLRLGVRERQDGVMRSLARGEWLQRGDGP